MNKHFLPKEAAYTKADLINRIGQLRGYSTYLECVSAATGWRYSRIDRAQYTARRLMYRCPDDFNDNLAIDYRSRTTSIRAALRQIRREGLGFDLIFVDPWHTYNATARDIREMFKLLNPGGTPMVHDCLPPLAAIKEPLRLGPDYYPGDWWGVTYRAFVDMVHARADMDFCTVNIDDGCGIIRKKPASFKDRLAARLGRWRVTTDEEAQVMNEWKRLGGNHLALFRLLHDEAPLLNRLVSLDAFLAQEEAACLRKAA